MELNGKEYSFSLTKISDAEKYQKALKILEDSKNNIDKSDYIGLLRSQCNACIGFFDAIFGPNAGAEIIPDTEDLAVCQKAVVDFIRKAKQAKENLMVETETLRQMTGSGNREQRRQAAPMTVAQTGQKKHHGKHHH